MASKSRFWKRASLNKLCLFMFIPGLLLLSGCEADPTVSTFERRLMNAQQHLFEENKLTVLTQSDYQAIWEDKIDPKEEASLLKATPSGLLENTKETRAKLEPLLFAFIKHIFNYRYTTITTDYFSSLCSFVTNPLSATLDSSEYYKNLYQNIYATHALSDIQMVEFYDQFTPQYITMDNMHIYRSKAIVITQNSADDTFFYKHPNLTRGANLHSIYLYYTNQEDKLNIFA